MAENLMAVKIKSIEEQLRGLRQQLSQGRKGRRKPKNFTELEGIWRGKVHFTDDEIEQVKFKIRKS